MKPFDFAGYLHQKVGAVNYNRANFILGNMEKIPQICAQVPTHFTPYEIVSCAMFIARYYDNPMRIYMRWRDTFGPMVALRCARLLVPKWIEPVQEFWSARTAYANQVYKQHKTNTK